MTQKCTFVQKKNNSELHFRLKEKACHVTQRQEIASICLNACINFIWRDIDTKDKQLKNNHVNAGRIRVTENIENGDKMQK